MLLQRPDLENEEKIDRNPSLPPNEQLTGGRPQIEIVKRLRLLNTQHISHSIEKLAEFQKRIEWELVRNAIIEIFRKLTNQKSIVTFLEIEQ